MQPETSYAVYKDVTKNVVVITDQDTGISVEANNKQYNRLVTQLKDDTSGLDASFSLPMATLPTTKDKAKSVTSKAKEDIISVELETKLPQNAEVEVFRDEIRGTITVVDTSTTEVVTITDDDTGEVTTETQIVEKKYEITEEEYNKQFSLFVVKSADEPPAQSFSFLPDDPKDAGIIKGIKGEKAKEIPVVTEFTDSDRLAMHYNAETEEVIVKDTTTGLLKATIPKDNYAIFAASLKPSRLEPGEVKPAVVPTDVTKLPKSEATAIKAEPIVSKVEATAILKVDETASLEVYKEPIPPGQDPITAKVIVTDQISGQKIEMTITEYEQLVTATEPTEPIEEEKPFANIDSLPSSLDEAVSIKPVKTAVIETDLIIETD